MSRCRTPSRSLSRLKLTRRELLHALQVGGVGAAAAGLVALRPSTAGATSVRGICRICTMHCGIVATTRGDRLLRVEGDPDSRTKGFVCHHGQALREIVHAEERLRLPLQRVGDRFREVPWDAALGEVARRLRAIRDEHGPEALVLQTGWPFVRHPIVHVLHRLAAAFGTPNVCTVASFCEAAGRMGKALVAGDKTIPEVGKARTLVVWGANPTYSAPPFAHMVAMYGKRGRNLIVIDPVKTELADGATEYLQVRPGTDGALALGLIHVVIREELHDAAHVAEHALGFDELARLAAQWPPERVAEVTTIPADQVIRTARLVATEGPTSIWDGLGIEHHDNAIQTIRAVTALAGICGHVGAPGGDQLLHPAGPGFRSEPLPVLYRMGTPEPVPPPVRARPLGYDEHPLYEVFNRQAQGNLLPRAVLEDRPYPVRALVAIGSNPLVTSPGSVRMRQALERLELLVVIDPFLSATGELADFVLPACTFAEAEVVGSDERRPFDELVARSGLVAEQHGSWPDWKILFELARALDLGRYFPWASFEEFLHAPRVPYMQDPAHSIVPDAGVPASPRYPSQTGKLELASPVLARFGHEPLPVWTPPRERPGPAFPLVLVSGPRTRPYINSQFRNLPSIRSKLPAPIARVHPEVAARAGLADGANARISTARGSIVMRVQVTDRVHREAVVLPAGWADPSVNVLVDGEDLDPISGFPAFRSAACRVEPA